MDDGTHSCNGSFRSVYGIGIQEFVYNKDFNNCSNNWVSWGYFRVNADAGVEHLDVPPGVVGVAWRGRRKQSITFIVSSGWPVNTRQTPPKPPATKPLAGLVSAIVKYLITYNLQLLLQLTTHHHTNIKLHILRQIPLVRKRAFKRLNDNESFKRLRN